jgi:hypothetical protein
MPNYASALACLVILTASAWAEELPASFADWKKARRDLLLAKADRAAIDAEEKVLRVAALPPALPADLGEKLFRSTTAQEGRARLNEALNAQVKKLEAERGLAEKAWESAAGRHAAAHLAQSPPVSPGWGTIRRVLIWGTIALGAGLLWVAGTNVRPRRPRWQDTSFFMRVARGLGGLAIVAALAVLVGWLAISLLRDGQPVVLAPPSVAERVAAEWSTEAKAYCDQAVEQRQEAERAGNLLARRRADLARQDKGAEAEWAKALHGKEAAKGLRDALRLGHEIEALREDAGELEKQAAAWEVGVSNTARHWWSAAVRCLLWLGVVGCALVPPLVVWGLGLWHRRANLVSCPRCLAGQVSPLPATGGPRASQMLKCSKCEYQLPSSHQHLYRLAVPSVGIVESGKTHFLVEFYDRVRQSNVPEAVRLALVETRSPYAKWISDVVDDIRRTARGTAPTGATTKGLPDALLFEFLEEQGKPDGVLLNVFDFAGELTNLSIHKDALRRRALGMDGFLLVLDPTQPPEPQRKALASFCQELREARQIWPGQPIPVPVAVCLTKIDLLVGATPLGEQALEWLERLRVMPRETLRLDVLQRRSKMVEEVLGSLFGTWNVMRDLKDNFGSNFCFFPLTPVGIDEDDDVLRGLRRGKESLKNRAQSPFGVLEPLLWLLHMHGYTFFTHTEAA